MVLLLELLLYVMAGFFIFAGYYHFKKPKFFLRIIPPFLPLKEWINWITGVAEIILGTLLLFPDTRSQAAWGVMVLLVAIFPANVYHLIAKGAGMKVPIWALWLRLPLQGVLIWWAYQYT